MYLHVHACIHMCVHACMHAWEYEHLRACTCVFICTLMVVLMHACMYIFAISFSSIEVGIAGCPPPPPNIEKPTQMSLAAFLGSPFETQNYFTFIPLSKKGCKDQRPIHSSTTFDPGHPIGK